MFVTSAAPSSQNLRRRPLVENRIPIAFWGEEILVPEGSPLQLSRLSLRNALCEARMPLEDVIRVNLYKNT